MGKLLAIGREPRTLHKIFSVIIMSRDCLGRLDVKILLQFLFRRWIGQGCQMRTGLLCFGMWSNGKLFDDSYQNFGSVTARISLSGE